MSRCVLKLRGWYAEERMIAFVSNIAIIAKGCYSAAQRKEDRGECDCP
jgi:hypothetical protein